MEREHFRELVHEAVESLPRELLMRVQNVDIVIEWRPTVQALAIIPAPRAGPRESMNSSCSRICSGVTTPFSTRSSRAFSAKSGQSEAGSTTTACTSWGWGDVVTGGWWLVAGGAELRLATTDR